MNEKIFKIGLILGIIFILTSIILIFFNILELINLSSNIQINEFSQISEILQTLSFSWSLIFFIFIIGYLIYLPCKHKKDIFKKLSLGLISLSVLFLTFSLFLLSTNIKTQDISEQIQPSLDYLIVSSLEDIILSQTDIQTNKQLNLQISTKSKIENIYNSNISLNQATLITNELNLNLDNQNKIIFIKFLISQIYETLKKENLHETTFPLTYLTNLINQEDLNTNLIESTDYSQIENLLDINNDASLKIEIIEEQEDLIVTIGNINEEKINLIWEQLKLKNNSFETKKTFIEITLSQIFLELEKENLQNAPIPISNLGTEIPNEIKTFLNYDLFNSNFTIRVNELNKIRNDCQKPNFIIEEICEGLNLTIYENIINNLQNISNENENLSKIPESIVENIKTSQDIENIIQKQTNSYSFLFFISFSFLILSILFYYLHFKLFKRDLIKTHIPYFISKNLSLKIGFSLPLIIIMYILMSSGYIFSFFENLINSPTQLSEELLLNIPIIITFIEILKLSLILHIILFLISICSYGLFYYLQTKELENL